MLERRGLLIGLGASVATPAIVRTAGLLMPVRALRLIQPALSGHAAIAAQGLTWVAPNSPPAAPMQGDAYFNTYTCITLVFHNGEWHRLTAPV